jgi:hypothetical protein
MNTAIAMGKKGHHVLTEGNNDEFLSGGAYDAYTKLNLRYSQVAPIDMFDEKTLVTTYLHKLIYIPAKVMNTTSYSLPRAVVVQIKHFYINRPRHYSIQVV